jgi:hypothetical protein
MGVEAIMDMLTSIRIIRCSLGNSHESLKFIPLGLPYRRWNEQRAILKAGTWMQSDLHHSIDNNAPVWSTSRLCHSSYDFKLSTQGLTTGLSSPWIVATILILNRNLN